MSAAVPSAAELSAAPFEITIGGKEFKLSPLNDEDYGCFEQWVRGKYVRHWKESTIDLDSDERVTLLREAFEKASTFTVTGPECMQAMVTLSGMVKLIWLAARKNHAEITEVNIFSLLEHDVTAQMDGNEAIDLVTGGTPHSPPPSPPSPPEEETDGPKE